MGEDSSTEELTQLLRAWRDGDDRARDRLAERVYVELQRVAVGYLRHERVDHTLQSTALVHEAYLRLAEGATVEWRDRLHFYRLAARAMRRILVDHARRHRAAKRGDGARVQLDETRLVAPESPVDLVDVHAALERLKEQDPRQAEIVELRFFAGLTVEETAEALGLSRATVNREWRFARAWLKARLESEPRTT